jgi:DNA-binding Lrp family transcriptional regulator
MPKNLDGLDVRILEGLAEHGPRNIAELAKELHIPRGTVISRINHMSSSFYLRLLTTVYHTNLGMKKAVVFAKATLGHEELLFNCLKANKFYIYLGRCYGMFEGCIGIYAIPVEHTNDFEDFLKDVQRLAITQEIDLRWSTCFHTVNLTSKWFDSSTKTWVFPWKKWVEEVFSADSELPYTLKDPQNFPLKADETDVFILKELEKDATVSLASIAKKLGTSLQNVRYHFEKHVTMNGLVETYQIAILPYGTGNSDLLFFIFKFEDMEKMAKFARSLLDKPFVTILGKILGDSSLVAQICLPRQEFRGFTDALSNLARTRFLLSYEYVFQDLRQGRWSRETIPYEFFKNGSWIYENSKYAETLHRLASSSRPV